jgi:LysM repeat protein
MSPSRRARSQSLGRPRRGFSKGAVTAALIVGLLIGAGATYVIAGPVLNRTTTATKTLPVVTSTSTTTVTVSQTSQAVATVASNGLRLSTFVNATDIKVGQKLNISISLFNTLPTVNAFSGQESFAQAGNRPFYGVPVATWTVCNSQHPWSWPLPIDVVVLYGNYSAKELTSVANASISIACGGFSPSIPSFAFEPNSDQVNLTVQYPGGVGNRNIGVFQLASNFTVSGYWNLTSLAANNPSICAPAVLNRCALPPSTPFAPGVYTVGVADEWGQYNVLHFHVSGPG